MQIQSDPKLFAHVRFGSKIIVPDPDLDPDQDLFDKKIGIIFVNFFLKVGQFVFDYLHISLENLENTEESCSNPIIYTEFYNYLAGLVETGSLYQKLQYIYP
jgi:hypothetical protein